MNTGNLAGVDVSLLGAVPADAPSVRRTARHRRDPRDAPLSERDIAALRFIGRGAEVAQYQLHEGVFGNVSEVIVSRFVGRAAARDLVSVSRWRGIGINRLRLTRRGRAILIANGVDPLEIFVPSSPIADGHIEHHLWIVDVLAVLGRVIPKPDVLVPAWALERRFTPRPAAIPDVLASFSLTNGGSLLLAVEVDRGSESIASVFAPKLRELCSVLENWAGGATSVIVVFTRGARRREAIQARVAKFPVQIVTELLPPVSGRAALAEFQRMLNLNP
jgi:hypothetical protein